MNKSILSKLLIFAAGAAIGSVVTWAIVKTKYEQIANEEIESVREHYSNKTTKERKSTEEPDKTTEYSDVIKNEGYVKEEEEKKKMGDRPFVISPEEFGEMDDYEVVSLIYYADGTVTDDWNNVIESDVVDELVGKESLKHFGEYEDDSVFVRNTELMTDYEILADVRKFTEVKC